MGTYVVMCTLHHAHLGYFEVRVYIHCAPRTEPGGKATQTFILAMLIALLGQYPTITVPYV